jgi:hypothetical protein
MSLGFIVAPFYNRANDLGITGQDHALTGQTQLTPGIQRAYVPLPGDSESATRRNQCDSRQKVGNRVLMRK